MQRAVVPAAMAGEELPGEVLVEMLARAALLELLQRGQRVPYRQVAGRRRAEAA